MYIYFHKQAKATIACYHNIVTIKIDILILPVFPYVGIFNSPIISRSLFRTAGNMGISNVSDFNGRSLLLQDSASLIKVLQSLIDNVFVFISLSSRYSEAHMLTDCSFGKSRYSKPFIVATFGI